MKYDEAFEHLVGLEGNYVDDPSDSGGKTKYGITERVAREHGYTEPMIDMPLGVAKAIYKTSYWSKAGCDYIVETYPRLAYEMFDSGVNVGVSVAVKWLQSALNAFNNVGALYGDLDVDGMFGPSTCTALQSFYKFRGAKGEQVLLAAINAQQGTFYLHLSQTRQKDEKYVYGWFLNRVVA